MSSMEEALDLSILIKLKLFKILYNKLNHHLLVILLIKLDYWLDNTFQLNW